MKEYRLKSKITISAYTVVEADTLEEAIEIAKSRDTIDYINTSRYNTKDTWISEEVDGEPFDIQE